ncbi:MAG TPA: hypothetical protein VFG87_07225 [Amycolatopsis sp.]|nr:hypothetical protein [Amycolatopsis sp.]
MSWQEELRRLDADLAAGRITRHEHRKQRDELLAAVSGGGVTSPLAAPLGTAGSSSRAPGWQSANPGRAAAQFPESAAAAEPGEPAERPAPTDATQAGLGTPEEPGEPPEPSPEPKADPNPPTSQQANPPENPPANPESNPPANPEPGPQPNREPQAGAASLLATNYPTSAPSPADHRSTDSMRYPSMAEAPTVITRAVQPTQLPGFTPGPPHGPTVGHRPGAPHDRPGPRRSTWLFLAIGVVVVLAMIIGATWFFSARGTNDNAGSASPSSTIVTPRLDVENKLPDLPGKPNPNSSTMSVDKAVQLQVITADEASKIRASGAQEVVYRASSDTTDIDDGYMLLAIPTSSANDAANLVAGLRETLTGAGFTADPLGGTNAETAYTGSNATGRVSAVWYASGSVTIGIGVSEPLTADPADLQNRLTQVLASVTATLPPN